MKFILNLANLMKVFPVQSFITTSSIIPIRCHRGIFTTRRDLCQDVKEFKFSKVSEKEYMKLQNDPDVFGPTTASEFDTNITDEGDEIEERYVSERPRALRTKEYADMIKDHLKNNRVKEAIDVLEIKMVKDDRAKPENYIYNLVIGGCARAGYTKKAFQLYNRMKQRDLQVTGGTYTALFNACANSPFVGDGLKRANHLREIMIEKNYEPNLQNYNAMIKAYGRCGDLMTAFQLVDEMVQKRLPVRVDTLNFLLQACITDKQFGFRHALLVWHKMMRWRIRPDIYSFNLLLRCTRDCGIGDVETTEEVIKKIISNSNTKLLKSPEIMEPANVLSNEASSSTLIRSDISEESVEVTGESLLPDNSIPNLISDKPHLGQLIGLHEIQKAEDRLLLLGGMKGFFSEMEEAHNTQPDIKTFTEMLEVIPPTVTAEKYLLSVLRKRNLRVDIDFFNMLIKKRSLRFDYESAKEVLKMAKTARLAPDIVTYGVLALGCRNQVEAEDLINQMAANQIRMNIEILGAMLKQGCIQLNFPYVMAIVDLSITENIRPNEQFITHLHRFFKKCVGLKRSESEVVDKDFSRKLFMFNKKMEQFNEKYGLVDRNLEESIKRIQIHPYDQFRENQTEGFEKVKNEKKRFLKKYARKLGQDSNQTKLVASE